MRLVRGGGVRGGGGQAGVGGRDYDALAVGSLTLAEGVHRLDAALAPRMLYLRACVLSP